MNAKQNKQIAAIVLKAIDEKAPVTVNWNLEKVWIAAIVAGLEEAGKL